MTRLFATALIRLLLALRGRLGLGVIANPFQTVHVPPTMINRYLIDSNLYRYQKIFRNQARVAGLVKAGDWDSYLKDIDLLPTTADFNKVFVENKGWEETTYYREYRQKGRVRDCADWEEFLSRHAARWEALYADIKAGGYRSQRQLKRSNSAGEVEIAVSSRGELLFIDGRHRFLMAKTLGLETIPVIVNLWHHDYIKRVKALGLPGPLTPRTAIGPLLEGRLKPAP